jgi:hypothetical protein
MLLLWLAAKARIETDESITPPSAIGSVAIAAADKNLL